MDADTISCDATRNERDLIRDFKKPLSIIIGATDFLIKYHKEIPDDKRLNFLNEINSSAMKLKQLINEIEGSFNKLCLTE